MKTIIKFLTILLILNTLIFAQISIPSDNNISHTPETDDVKFIIASSLSTARWKPGLSSVDKFNQKLLDYKTEGLKLYSIKGKVNIFDSDVLTIEKYGTFSSTKHQSQLIKLYKEDKNKNATLSGLNISIKVFLLLKYFYLKDYNYLDALEYQYYSYQFSGLATNRTSAIFWYGETTNGIENKDFFKLSRESKIDFFTDFKENILYVIELANMIQNFPITSAKIGLYNIHWLKPLFLGSYSQNDIPIIHYTELVSSGMTLDLSHKFHQNFKTGINLSYGFDNHINYTNNSLDIDYYSYKFYLNYNQKIYSHSSYSIFTYGKVFSNKKIFQNNNFTLNNENVNGVSFGLQIVF